jgi:hypothetical protein
MAEINPRDRAALYNRALTDMANGGSHDYLINLLTENGMDAEEATTTLGKMRIDLAQTKVDKAKREIRNGGLWCGGGLLVTLISYAAVSQGGGSYLVCWGAVIFGALQLFKGINLHSTALKELEEAGAVTAGEKVLVAR